MWRLTLRLGGREGRKVIREVVQNSGTLEITKGDDAAPVASSPSAYCCFVCRFSQSCDCWRSPRSPNYRVTSSKLRW